MQMGNADIEVNTLLELQRLGFVIEAREDESEIFVSVSGVSLQNDGLLKAIDLICNLGANEVSVEEGRIRLWWD